MTVDTVNLQLTCDAVISARIIGESLQLQCESILQRNKAALQDKGGPIPAWLQCRLPLSCFSPVCLSFCLPPSLSMSVQVSPVRSFRRHVLLSVPAGSLAGPSALHQLIIHLQFSGSSSVIHCRVGCYSCKNDTIFSLTHVASFVFDSLYSPRPVFAP